MAKSIITDNIVVDIRNIAFMNKDRNIIVLMAGQNFITENLLPDDFDKIAKALKIQGDCIWVHNAIKTSETNNG